MEPEVQLKDRPLVVVPESTQLALIQVVDRELAADAVPLRTNRSVAFSNHDRN